MGLLDRSSPLSIRRQSDLLTVSRSRLYYQPKGESPENLTLMQLIDQLYLLDPTRGVLRMQDKLRDMGYTAGRERIRRLRRKMGIEAIYPKRNLSRLGLARYIHPYLLRGLEVIRPNQVWAIDITYVPMKQGFLYLTAIIDLYSRYIVGWGLSNTLEKETQTAVLQGAIERYGKPEIINSDQGSQYTSEHWVKYLQTNGIRISMDSKGRATDNAFIERWFRTIKQQYIYLNPAENGLELYQGIDRFIDRYNHQESHQGIDRKKPKDLYQRAA